MFYDSFLVSTVETLADGRDAHLVVNLISAYKGAYHMALDSGMDEDVELFKRAERELISFVARKRTDDLNPDDYIDEERYKPHRHEKPID